MPNIRVCPLHNVSVWEQEACQTCESYGLNGYATEQELSFERMAAQHLLGEHAHAGPAVGYAGYTMTPMPLSKLDPSVALKHDSGKPDFSFISYELMEQISLVRAFGAKKYSRNNWKKGFKVTRSCAAALRHIFQFLSGETNDSESGLLHLAHAVCCLEHAIYDMKKHPENDDRDKE